MRRFMANNFLVLNRINEFEVKQLSYQKDTDEKFDKVFQYISEHEEVSQKIHIGASIKDAGKNALDFYIAVECGILGVQGEKKKVLSVRIKALVLCQTFSDSRRIRRCDSACGI